jgi:ribosome-associated protein
MDTIKITEELAYKAIKSSGPGGQHVNKVASKVVLSFHVAHSKALSDDEKELLLKALASRLSKEGVLMLSCDESRSQHKNKVLVTERCFEILKAALYVPKKRKASKPGAASILKIKEEKQRKSLEKILRKKPDLE